MTHRFTPARPGYLWPLCGLALVFAVFVSACGGDAVTPAAPTATPPQTQTPTSTPTATPAPPGLVGVWNLTVRLTAVTALPGGGSCIAESMRSQLGVPNPYALSITDDGQVTIASASGDYACSFRPPMDSGGFSDGGSYYYCKGEPQTFRCGSGETYSLVSWGQGISGRVSGSEIAGTWEIVWCVARNDSLGCVEVETQFAGTK